MKIVKYIFLFLLSLMFTYDSFFIKSGYNIVLGVFLIITYIELIFEEKKNDRS